MTDPTPAPSGSEPPGTVGLAGGLRWSVALCGLAVYELLVLGLALVAGVLCLVGVGVPLLARVLVLLRRQTRRQRLLVPRYTTVKVDRQGDAADDEADALPVKPGLGGWAALLPDLLADRRTHVALLWSLLNPLLGLILVLVPVALIASGLFGLAMPLIWDQVNDAWGDSWYLFVPLQGPVTALAAAALGAVQVALGLIAVRPCLDWHGLWVSRRLQGQSARELRRRLRVVSKSRSDLVDLQARELRRIERDLHDGAQARLVAMGMTLSAASRLMRSDPERAQQLVLDARDASASALRELRDLVRGVHPPVLADRGVVDAVRSMALESSLPVRVTSTLTTRPPLPLESALFFAISELLANVVKHARATRVEVSFYVVDGDVVTVVRDDGVGGVEVRPGSGLDGIRRRLAAFDGDLSATSQPGWASAVRLRVPLAAGADGVDLRRDKGGPDQPLTGR